ncbi:MAG: hypothetical protein U9O98_10435 [Asgard group archaeon]|nr:hypothetical protein [Asgard group archaeon]
MVFNHKESDFGCLNPPTLTEKQMADVLLIHLKSFGYKAVKELVLNESLFDIAKLTGKKISKVRIDIAALKNDKICFIEIENGCWVTHPLLYRNFAHRVFLAYPAEVKTPTDKEQIAYAKAEGLGVVTISTAESIKQLVPPKDRPMIKSLEKAIISLINQKL